jgi:uncharacterized phage infection (PIP) family protein YhgE|tara:strand:+ start:4336 stop:4977 length:642 start_codon:yes stop_codon:yes gene_type:complete
VFGFGKKKKEGGQAAAPGTPLEQVMALKQKGMTNDQIIPELEKQGYDSSQIFEALNQVNISGGGVGQGPVAAPLQPPFPQEQIQQPLPQPPVEQPPVEAPQPQAAKEQIEEVAEAIIDEKWKEFEGDLKIVIDWKEKTENRINRFEQQIKDLTNSLSSLHKSLVSKISEYDKNITDVGTEIKAMEKVFEKVLPSLTENVNKLDRLAKSSKLKK